MATVCAGQQAEIRPSSRDRYGRTVARVLCAGTDANAAMVRAGMAWAYTRYLTDPQIPAMEIVARRERIGLWADADPVPPWIWRQCGGKGAESRASSPLTSGQPLASVDDARRESNTAAAWVLLKPRRAAIAARCAARGRALPASQL